MRHLTLALLLACGTAALAQNSYTVPASGQPAPSLAATPTLCTVTGQVPTGVDIYGNALGCGFLNAQYVTGAAKFSEVDVTYSATPVFSAAATLNYLQLTGAVTSSTLAAAATGGMQTTIVVCQDNVGARVFVWPANVKAGPTISALPNKCSSTLLVWVNATSTWDSVGPGLVNF